MKMASQSTKLRLSAAAAALFLACTLASASSSSIYSPSRKVFSVLRFAKDRVPGLGGKGIAMVRDGHGDEVLEYDDFSEMVPFLAKSGIAPMDRKQKRYLGIDIPDYISAGGKSDALKSMSNKMKALG